MTASVLPGPKPPFKLLGNRGFLLLWCAYGVSAMGDHLSEMALLKTQNAASSKVDVTPLDARMTFLFFVPFFLLAPLAGWLADRLPRRGLMITADLARCGLLFSFTALMGATQGWGAWGPFMPLVLVGVFAALFSPARSALLPTLIRPDQLVRANGLFSGVGIIATMVALQLGGYLAEHYKAELAFRLDSLTFLTSAALLWVLHAPSQRGPAPGRVGVSEAVQELLGGFRYARCHRRVLELLAVAALVWFCGPLIKCVMPAIVRDVYGGSYQAMSGFRIYLGLGFIIGSVLVSMLGDALRGEIAITWGLFGSASGIAVFSASAFLSLSPNTLYVIGAVGVVATGAFGVAVMAGYNSLLQRIVPDRFRGRVFGVKDACCNAALLAATGLLGIPAWTRVDRWVGYILGGAALILAVAGLVTLTIRLRRSVYGVRLGFAENLNEFVAKFWWRLKRIGPATLPRHGAVVLTANHTCSADPLFLSAAIRYRPISFMVAAEYTTWPVFRFFMRLVECIPVKRDGRDTAATKRAIRHLRAGKALGIFIEGRIVPPGEAEDPKDGVALLALRTGAKVIPAYISGRIYHRSIVRDLLARHDARVRFGPPIDLSEFQQGRSDRATLRAATRKIFAAIQALAPRPDEPATGRDPGGVGRRTGTETESSHESL